MTFIPRNPKAKTLPLVVLAHGEIHGNLANDEESHVVRELIEQGYAVIAHPEDYQACYAGVPVSDLEERIKIRGKQFEELFSAPYHLGKTVAEAPEEYRRRSPAWNVEKLKTPLLIHANTSDDDVKFQEVQKLLAALQSSGKTFQSHIYTNALGGHYFNRIDTEFARQSRDEIWQFLAKYLKASGKVGNGTIRQKN